MRLRGGVLLFRGSKRSKFLWCCTMAPKTATHKHAGSLSLSLSLGRATAGRLAGGDGAGRGRAAWGWARRLQGETGRARWYVEGVQNARGKKKRAAAERGSDAGRREEAAMQTLSSHIKPGLSDRDEQIEGGCGRESGRERQCLGRPRGPRC